MKQMKNTLAALLVLAVLAAGFAWLAQDDRVSKPMHTNGDVVGPDLHESAQDYQARTQETLDQAPADEPGYALIAFRQPMDAEAAGKTLESLKRVNAIVPANAAPIPLPEPTEGVSRGQVLEREWARVGLEPPAQIEALMVYDTGDALRALATSPDVFSIEVLAPDAAWGRFGIRPPARAGLPSVP
ncbi:hypothetical protein SAMN05660282_00755 [Corynebacterium spheniscorum]|uniref:LytR cell envelope-related transcriptional attenuator n=2 Tax=Corynebacterium spheniscorum TaxID=185761 RepID=A0A1I2RLF5_9CORY|nr:hypothetical protein [Corynebacterium spheniscorum]KAA8722651.1 hypothetical protein F4V56_04405 [Corynebacterium spheniscorum]SFG38606.1 hypothetical protein SAMN05660282_00755 [Corynebacterium spheniscorum]